MFFAGVVLMAGVVLCCSMVLCSAGGAVATFVLGAMRVPKALLIALD